MPFTLAHPAAVLAFVRPGGDSGRFGLPISALVIGSVVPDLSYYLPIPVSADLTHSLHGLLVDVLLGVACYFAWIGFVMAPMLWIAPAPVQRRIPLRWRRPLRERLDSAAAWAALVAALLLGAATHLFLDGFTHSGMWAAQRWPALRDIISGRAVYDWLQLGTSAVGLALIVAALVFWWRRSPADAPASGHHVVARVGLLVGWALASVGFGLACVADRYGVALVAASVRELRSLVLVEAIIITGLLRTLAAAVTLVVIGAAAWHLARALGAITDPPATPPPATRATRAVVGQP